MSLNQEDFKRYKEIWKETGSYLEQETFNAQYAWDKINRINKERDNKRKRLVNIGYIIFRSGGYFIACPRVFENGSI